MDHNDIRHKLSEYIDGSVSAREKAGIEEHLKTCAKCSDALNELRKTVQHIKAVEEVDPPAWLARKIMAKVRAETKEKKSAFQRLFYPLSIKLPLEAMAVVFLAVTAFYLYQNIQPSQKFAEAPQTRVAKRDANRETGTSPRLKQVPQAPGYKALDMKPEYEKPAPPVPLGKTVPATEGMTQEKRLAAPQASSTDMMREQGGPVKDFAVKKEAKAATPALSAKAKLRAAADSTSEKNHLTLNVQDVAVAAQNIRKLLAQREAKLIKQEVAADAIIMTISINPSKARSLVDELKSIGTLKEKDMDIEQYEETVTLEITVMRPAPGVQER